MTNAEEKDLREKILFYHALQERLETLLKERQVVLSKINELQTTLRNIEELKRNKKVLFSIGSNAFVPGKVLEKGKLIVEVGANIALKKSFDEGREIIEKRIEQANKVLRDLEEGIRNTSTLLERLTPQIQSMLQQKKKGS